MKPADTAEAVARRLRHALDTDLAISTGELGNMIPELLEAVGGEMPA